MIAISIRNRQFEPLKRLWRDQVLAHQAIEDHR